MKKSSCAQKYSTGERKELDNHCDAYRKKRNAIDDRMRKRQKIEVFILKIQTFNYYLALPM